MSLAKKLGYPLNAVFQNALDYFATAVSYGVALFLKAFLQTDIHIERQTHTDNGQTDRWMGRQTVDR